MNRIRRAGALVSACLVLALAALSPAPAAAQSVTLVSNIGRGDGDTGNFRQFDQAQAFTTGDNTAGYTLTSVEVEFTLVSSAATSVTYAVGIWSSDEEVAASDDSDSLHEPHTLLGALTCPTLTQSNADAVYECTATTAIDLAANTTYLFVIDSSSSANAHLRNTNQDAEDSGAASGWTIADNSIYRNRGTTGSWTTWSNSKKIRVKGTVKSANNAPTVANAIPDQSATVGTAFSYAFPANTFNDADSDTLTYTPTLADGSALPSWLTWTAADRKFEGTPPQTAGGTTLSIKVTATDTNSASVSDTFDLEVRAATTPMSSALVSNLNNADEDGTTLNSLDSAQAFTTGPNAAGYTLASVDLRLRAPLCRLAPHAVPAVTLRSGLPSAGRVDLSTTETVVPCGTSSVTVTYTAPPGTTLDASTEYFVVVEAGSTGAVVWRSTSDPDQTAEAGWSVDDKHRRRTASSSGAFGTENNHVQFLRINGAAIRGPNRSPRVANRIPDQSAEIGAFFSYVIPENTFTDADGDALRYEARRGKLYYPDGRIFNTVALDYFDGYTRDGHPWLAFDAETRTLSGHVAPGSGRTGIRIVARDGRGGRAETEFRINATAAAPGLLGNLRHAWMTKRRLDWFDQAQKFTTGAHSTGYTVTSVDLVLEDVRSVGRLPEVRIRSGKGNGSTVARLRAPTSGAVSGTKLYRYTAPANTLLAASTDYWVSIEGERDDVGVMVWNLRSSSPDAGSAAGWSFSNRAERRSDRYFDYTDPPNRPTYTAMRINGTGTAAGAHCDATDAQEVWCSTMTVGEVTALSTTTGYGYVFSNAGSLSELSFSFGGVSYSVRGVYLSTDSNPTLRVEFNPLGTSVFNSAEFNLVVGNDAFSFGDATIVSHTFFRWADSGLSWSEDDTVAVKLLYTGTQQEAPEAPTIEGTPAIGGVGTNSVWDAGDTLTVTLTFSEAVEVDETGGTPSVGFDLGGTKPRTASYASGSGTTQLVFEYDVVSGDGSSSLVSMTGNNVALNGGTITSVASGTDADLAHQGVLAQGGNAPRSEDPPRVTFEGLPESHDGSSAFTLRIAFSAPPTGLSAKSDAASVLAVTGGSVTGARDVSQDGAARWEVTVTPDGRDDVRVEIPARACTETGAVCVNGQGLREAVEGSVPVEAGPEPIVARWSHYPDEHRGRGRFAVELDFSTSPAGFSWRWLKSSVVSVEGGRIVKVKRRSRGRNDRWRLEVRPAGDAHVTLTVNATTDCGAEEAVCTAEGGRLAGGARAIVYGPASLSVADARVAEAEGATLDFVVTLGRQRTATTTVEYATSDGTARAGDDYERATGTLTFAPTEIEKTVSVTVLDDAHDEGDETMTLTLSNASGAQIADATATGTIENADPMPQAWALRFGRTVGTQVVEALGRRLDGAHNSHVTVGGMRLTGESAQAPDAQREDPFALPAWATQEREAPAQTMTARELVLGSAFHLSSAEDGAGGEPAFTAWGTVATGGFETEEDDVTLDGDVTTGMVGFDAEWDGLLAGVMLSQSEGDGAYALDASQGDDQGTVESSMTGVYPYARFALNARVSAWAVAGAGSGELTLHQEGKRAMPTDLSMRLGALGVKGQVLDGSGGSGLVVNVKSDALWVGTKTEDTDELAETEGDVTRLRLILQGERAFASESGATFVPSAEVGLRHDGGDAETGAGLEVGAGVRYTAGSLTLEGRARPRIAPEASGYEEWGLSGALSVSPGNGGRGLTLSVRPEWGRAGSASEALWSVRDAGTLAGWPFDAEKRLALDAGYGLGAGGGVLTPYVGMTLGEGGSRTLRGGARWELKSDLAVGLEATRSESADADAASDLRLRATLRF